MNFKHIGQHTKTRASSLEVRISIPVYRYTKIAVYEYTCSLSLYHYSTFIPVFYSLAVRIPHTAKNLPLGFFSGKLWIFQ